MRPIAFPAGVAFQPLSHYSHCRFVLAVVGQKNIIDFFAALLEKLTEQASPEATL